MRAAVLGEGGWMEIQELPLPASGPREMLLRTVSCGLCGSDLYKIRNRTVAPGTVLGHEIVGVVETCPSQYGSRFPTGSRVTVSNHIPCGECAACRRGRVSMCPQFQATHVDPGGFAEFIRVPARHIPEGVISLPDGVPDHRALLLEPLGCCLRALERWDPRAGDRVMVVGLGPVGLLMVLLSRWMGVIPVGVDPLEDRRQMAKEKGCPLVFHPEDTERMGQPRGVVLTACTPQTLGLALRTVEAGGWIGLFAGPRQDLPVVCGLQVLYRKEVDLIPSYSTGPVHMRRALELLENREIDVDGLISHELPIEEIQRAVDMAEAQQGLKAMLRF